MKTATEILAALEAMRDDSQAAVLMRFFKTGPGQYGEGDRFLGLKVPQTRQVVKQAAGTPLQQIEPLLYSDWHEARLAGFLLLVQEMKSALPRRTMSPAQALHSAERRDEIAGFYLRHARQACNWDLVDLSCPKIVGEWLLHPTADGHRPDRSVLDRLAASSNLWEQRIGIVSTLRLIKAGETADTLRIATSLLTHPHDLIHKATGWMLREVGKTDPDALTGFLEVHHRAMPRTALRYAIERMENDERRYWMTR